MIDVMKVGGVSGWLQAAAIAGAHGRTVSSHLFPEISAHLLAATPERHRLEYLDLAAPIRRESLALVSGSLSAGTEPGSGVTWDAAAVEAFRAP